MSNRPITPQVALGVMATLESAEVAGMLNSKIKAVVRRRHDLYYDIYDKDGAKLCFTRISHGPKETLKTG